MQKTLGEVGQSTFDLFVPKEGLLYEVGEGDSHWLEGECGRDRQREVCHGGQGKASNRLDSTIAML